MPKGIYDRSKSNYVPWNKGLRGVTVVSEETKAKLREKRKGKRPALGRKQPEDERAKRREIALRIGSRPPSSKGVVYSPEIRQRMSEAQRAFGYMQTAKGSKTPNWKGGITSPNKLARTSKSAVEWRNAVFERDNWTCRKCGANGVHLHSHHIKEFAKYPELRFDISNGLTLCKQCHMEHHGLAKQTAAT